MKSDIMKMYNDGNTQGVLRGDYICRNICQR